MSDPQGTIIKGTEMWCMIGLIIAGFARLTDLVLVHGFMLVFFEIRRQGGGEE